MTTLGIRIVNEAAGKQVARDVQVFAVQKDEEGNIIETDISNAVRSIDARIHYGEVVTAKLECFVTGIETRAEIEELILRDLKPRKRSLWRALRDVTTLGSPHEEYVR